MVYGTPDILAGYRDHVSGCCDRRANEDQQMLGNYYMPKPSQELRKAVTKVQLPDSTGAFIISSLGNYDLCRGTEKFDDTVALRMLSYVPDSDQEFDFLEPELNKHRAHTRRVAVEKEATEASKACSAARKELTKGSEDSELMETLDKLMMTGQTAHAIFCEDKKSDSVLLHIKNKSMKQEGVSERQILGMIHRGLCVRTEKDDASASFLSCQHHSKPKFLGLWTAREHFQKKGYHLGEEAAQRLEDYESGAEEEEPKTDDSLGPGHWLAKGAFMLGRSGWKHGDGLGKDLQGPKLFRVLGREVQAEPEQTMRLCGLMKGFGPGLDARVVFQKGEVLAPSKGGITVQGGASSSGSSSSGADAPLPSQPPQLDAALPSQGADAALPSQPSQPDAALPSQGADAGASHHG